MGKSTGKLLNTIMLIPQNYPWSIVRRAPVREYSDRYIENYSDHQ